MHERRRHFFRHGELHLVLLALLGVYPQHGYDLLAELEARFAPRYTPSPGSVYPALAALEEEELIEVVAEGGRRVYAVTDLGRRALEDREQILAGLEARTGVSVSPDGAVDAALASFVRRVRAAAPPAEELRAVLDATAARIERGQR